MADDLPRTSDAGAALARDLACVKCGYNLRGLPAEGCCPECGAAISLSTTAPDDAIADRRWAARTIVGARLYAITLVSALAVVLASAGAEWMRWRHEIGSGLLLLAFVGGAVSGAAAIWLSTRRSEYLWDLHWRSWFVILRAVSAIVAAAALTYGCLIVSDGVGRIGPAFTWQETISGGVTG